jgi:hypothetical protein
MIRIPILKRKSQRITITVPHAVYEGLQQVADDQGRSLSNLLAYLLECSLERIKASLPLTPDP